MTASEVEKLASEGIAALSERMGTVRALEFIRLCGRGIGDYTAHRHEWLSDVTLEGIAARAQANDQRIEELDQVTGLSSRTIE